MIEIARYAVMGNPIAHSKSPFIHRLFAQQTQQVMQYDAILVEKQAGEFAQTVHAFQRSGGKGFNVTIPFKQEAYILAEVRTQWAQRAGAVNTLWFDIQGKIHGDNTDGIGLVRDLMQNYGYHLTGQRILIIGAGGAVRGIIEPILRSQPTECVIVNRTMEKAHELVKLFTPLGKISASRFTDLAGQTFDLIINGTSASLQGELPPLPTTLSLNWCYDMMYAKTATPFMQWALQQGANQVLDGLGMLVEQAAEAFFIWRGVRPNTLPVIQQVREHM